MVSLALRAIFGIEHRPVPGGLHVKTVCGFLFMQELSWSYFVFFFPNLFFLLDIIVPILFLRFRGTSRMAGSTHSAVPWRPCCCSPTQLNGSILQWMGFIICQQEEPIYQAHAKYLNIQSSMLKIWESLLANASIYKHRSRRISVPNRVHPI